MPRPASDSIIVGRIRKIHGRRGEVAAEILTDFPDRFQPGRELGLSNGTTTEQRRLEGSWFHKGRAILKFSGCDSISAAEPLVGLWISIPGSERAVLPPGVFFLGDLLDCDVVENGQKLGTVEAIEEAGPLVLLNVGTPEGELLVPFAQEICRTVDVEKKQIEVRLPEGLRELNRNGPGSPGRRVAGRSRQRRTP